ncbi:MAG: EcsC family protein [Bacteroides sp.]|nr:EcsC family protein [Bacteroides sp.]
MANKLINNSFVLKIMNWAYEKAVHGMPGLESAQQMGEEFLKGKGCLKDKVDNLIRWQYGKAGMSGFMTGIGGLLAMPFTIPANIGSVLYIQIRMIAAIAYMGGYNLKDERVKALVFVCIAGNAGKDVLKNVGVAWGEKIMLKALNKISQESIVKINQTVGFKLVTQFGGKGFINLSKTVPLVGGLIGGTFDAVATNAMGKLAKKTFITSQGEKMETGLEVDEIIEIVYIEE